MSQEWSNPRGHMQIFSLKAKVILQIFNSHYETGQELTRMWRFVPVIPVPGGCHKVSQTELHSEYTLRPWLKQWGWSGGRCEEIINWMLNLALQRGPGAPVLADGFLLYPDCGELGRGVAFEEWPGVWRMPWELWKLFTNQSRNISPTSQLAQWYQYMPTITSPAQSYRARTEMGNGGGGQPRLRSCPTLIRACSSPKKLRKSARQFSK